LDLLLGQVRGRTAPEEFLLFRARGLIAGDPTMRSLVVPAALNLLSEASGSTAGAAAWMPEPEPAPAKPRFVNLAIERKGSANVVPRGRPLQPDCAHYLRVDIGDMSDESIVTNEYDHPFPSKELPPSPEGYWLEVGLTSADFDASTNTVPYFLPRYGAGWSCPCTPNGPHECQPDQRHPYIYISFHTPETIGSAQARLSLWFRNNLVQSLLIVADIDEPDARGAHVATIDYTLTDTLTDLNSVEPRGLSILTNQRPDGTHSLVFNGGTGEIGFTIAEAVMTEEINRVRQLQLNMHIEGSGKKRRNRLDSRNGKSRKDFIDDLGQLAQHGYRMWVSLYQQKPEILQAVTGKSTTTIQVARVPRTTFVFPWAAVYDIPLDVGPSADLMLCPVVESWDGAKAMVSNYPWKCPEESAHGLKNTLCPFGFWGIRHIIENPPSTRFPPRQVRLSDNPSAVVVRSHDLDRDLSDSHLNEVAQILSGFSLTTAESLNDTCTSLTEDDLQLVEFYCHGKGDPTRHWLEVGRSQQIHPEQITTWSIADWVPPKGPDRHWQTTTPLVLLNGCHTAELTPQSPVNFVDAFSSAHASGVIGTEITLHQSLAGEAVELMLRHFASGQVGIGEVVRRMRHDLLAKGNLLGLAYTPYCSAELRLAR
jgi:hypothetical protein